MNINNAHSTNQNRKSINKCIDNFCHSKEQYVCSSKLKSVSVQ